MNQLQLIVGIGLLTLFVALGGALIVQTYRLDHAKLEIERIHAAAAKAQAKADADVAYHEMLLEEANHDYTLAKGRIATLTRKLREQPRPDILPAPATPPASGERDVACFDRGAFNAAFAGSYGRFLERLEGIAGEGEGLAAALRACAAAWPRSRPPESAPPSARPGSGVVAESRALSP